MSAASAAKDAPPQASQLFEVPAGHELRFVIYGPASVTLVSGIAEAFGTLLVRNHKYSFNVGYVSVFSWEGCVLEVEGADSTGSGGSLAYVAQNELMKDYFALHKELEAYRTEVDQPNDPGVGPKVLVCGRRYSGKAGLCRLLASFAGRCGRSVALIDLDVDLGMISVPGAMSIMPITDMIDIEDAFSLIGPPLVFFYGHKAIAKNISHVSKIVKSCSDTLSNLFFRRPDFSIGGTIINTFASEEEKGFDELVEVIDVFRPSHVCVLDDDMLFSRISQKFQHLIRQPRPDSGRKLIVTKLRDSEGLSPRDEGHIAKLRMNRIYEYFHGPRTLPVSLSPYSRSFSFDALKFVRVGSGYAAPKDVLPIGSESLFDPCEIVDVEPNLHMSGLLCAVAGTNVRSDIAATPCAGIVRIVEVNVEKKQVTLTLPSPQTLPSQFIVCGSIQGHES